MAVDRDLVRQIARLACLELPRAAREGGAAPVEAHLLTDAELDRLVHELDAILAHVAELDALDLSGIEPTSHGVPLPTRLREDAVSGELPADVALQGAPQALESAFVVPKVVE